MVGGYKQGGRENGEKGANREKPSNITQQVQRKLPVKVKITIVT